MPEATSIGYLDSLGSMAMVPYTLNMLQHDVGSCQALRSYRIRIFVVYVRLFYHVQGANMHTRRYTYPYKYIYMYIDMYMRIYTHVCISCMYVYIYICMHVHPITHGYVQIFWIHLHLSESL